MGLPRLVLYPQAPEIALDWRDAVVRWVTYLPALLGSRLAVRNLGRARASGPCATGGDPAKDDITTHIARTLEAARVVYGAPPGNVESELVRQLRGRAVVETDARVQYRLAALAAAAAALAGSRVHVVTGLEAPLADEVERHAPLFRRLGLRASVVQPDDARESRIDAYDADVTWVAARDLVFDYLADRREMGNKATNLQLKLARLRERRQRPVLRGLETAILIDADLVLIDESRTPLIASAAGTDVAWPAAAFAMVNDLEPNVHFGLTDGGAVLTPAGREIVESRAAARGGVWRNRARREDRAVLALNALHHLVSGRDYTVEDGQIARFAPLSPDDGMRQLLEIKEGCEVSPLVQLSAKLTYQQFFRRYARLSGTSVASAGARWELWKIYRLLMVRRQRVAQKSEAIPVSLVPSTAEKWRWVAECANTRKLLVIVEGGRAVQELGEALATAGIACSPTRKPGTGTPEQRGAQVFVHCCSAVGPFLPEALPLQNASMIVLADGLYGHRTEQRLTREVADSGRDVMIHRVSALDEPLWENSLWARFARSWPRFIRIGARAAYRARQSRFARRQRRARSLLLSAGDRRRTSLAFSGEEI